MIDTLNKFLVSVRGGCITIMRTPDYGLTPDEALVLAAYLVALAEPNASHRFSEVLEAVRNV